MMPDRFILLECSCRLTNFYNDVKYIFQNKDRTFSVIFTLLMDHMLVKQKKKKKKMIINQLHKWLLACFLMHQVIGNTNP